VSAADWKPYDVPGLAGLLAEQPTDSGTHAMAWQQAYETLTDQRQRLGAARTALTEAWPATPGSAAGSFFDQVEALTQAMSATADTAVNAHGALTGIVTAVDGATAKVDTLHQSWQQNQATIGGVVPADDWTEPLNNQAHAVMGQADAAIAEHATQLTPPVPYSLAPPIQKYTPIQSSTGPAPIGGSSNSQPTNSAAPQTPRQRQNAAIDRSTVQVAVNQASTTDLGPVLTGRHNAVSVMSKAGGATGRTAFSPIEDPIHEEFGSQNAIGRSTIVGLPSARTSTQSGSAARSSDQTIRESAAATSSGVEVGTLGRTGLNSSSTRTSSIRVHSGHPGVSTDQNVESVQHQPAAEDSTNSIRSGADGMADPRGSSIASTPVHTEPAALGGMIPGAPIPAGGPEQGRRRTDDRQPSAWPMPRGIRPIIVALPDLPIRHDPGTGVIGIDL
jgi:hypothetical protein